MHDALEDMDNDRRYTAMIESTTMMKEREEMKRKKREDNDGTMKMDASNQKKINIVTIEDRGEEQEQDERNDDRNSRNEREDGEVSLEEFMGYIT